MTTVRTIQQRRDTAANWRTVNPTLAIGEVGWETDTRRAKLGNGTFGWNALAYASASAGFNVRDYGWTAPTTSVPKPDNTAALQAAIAAAYAWQLANDPLRASRYATNRKADVDFASMGFVQSADMTGIPTGATLVRFDWHQPVHGESVLIKNHEDGTKNGVYTVNSAGAWPRRADLDTSAEWASATYLEGASVHVRDGYHQGKSTWYHRNYQTIYFNLGVDVSDWWGVSRQARPVVVSDGQPIYVSDQVEVLAGVELHLTGPIVALSNAANREQLLVFRQNASWSGHLTAYCESLYGGVLINGAASENAASFGSGEVFGVKQRGVYVARDVLPGSATCPIFGVQTSLFGFDLPERIVVGGADVCAHIASTDHSVNIYALAGTVGAWVLGGALRLDITTDYCTEEQIVFDACGALSGSVKAIFAGFGGSVATQMFVFGRTIPYAYAQNNTIDLTFTINGYRRSYTDCFAIGNTRATTLRLASDSGSTFFSNLVRWTDAAVAPSVVIEANIPAGVTPVVFASGITQGGVVRYTQGGLARTIEATSRFSADRGDASVTLAASEVPNQLFATALTVNRTVTLPTTGLYPGLSFTVIRTGLGAFTLAVGSAKTIPASTAASVRVEYSGSAWVLTNYSPL